jgi:hypothetical protein
MSRRGANLATSILQFSIQSKHKTGSAYWVETAMCQGRFVFAHITGFTYYVYMNITLSIDDDLIKEVRKIAVERDTTLTGLVRDYLRDVAAEHARSGRKRREREALERSFRQFQFRVGRKTWKREELHERS